MVWLKKVIVASTKGRSSGVLVRDNDARKPLANLQIPKKNYKFTNVSSIQSFYMVFFLAIFRISQTSALLSFDMVNWEVIKGRTSGALVRDNDARKPLANLQIPQTSALYNHSIKYLAIFWLSQMSSIVIWYSKLRSD